MDFPKKLKSYQLISYFKDIYHKLMPLLGAIIYGFPSRKIFVIGVTGTKGKTTVTELINAGLEAAGYKTAVNNSVRHKVGDMSEANKGNSMPGRFFLQKFLRGAVRSGCKYAIIEVTSEGISQHRHERIEFDAAVFTNIHPEHIEAHGGFEKYREAKVKLFKYTKDYSKKPRKYYFVNKDDENSKYFAAAAAPAEALAKEGEMADVTCFSQSDLPSSLIGDFNKSNVGAAEVVLKKIGIKNDVIAGAIANFKGVPGRMEFIQKEPFAMVVDYAHTPESLEAVYVVLGSRVQGLGSGEFKTKPYTIDAIPSADRRLICVFGSFGGGRDKWKRPRLGEIASRYCREIILTDEGPFEEDADQILSEIRSGISNDEFRISNVRKINDRREAMRKAVELARPNDTIIITGKGTEAYIAYPHGRKVPWLDSKVALDVLREKGYNHPR